MSLIEPRETLQIKRAMQRVLLAEQMLPRAKDALERVVAASDPADVIAVLEQATPEQQQRLSGSVTAGMTVRQERLAKANEGKGK